MVCFYLEGKLLYMQNSDEYLQYPGIGTGKGRAGRGEHAANVIIFWMVQTQIVLAAVAEQQSHYGIQPVLMYSGRAQPT